MASLNKVSLIGNVGKDPEIKTFDNGKVATFTLATSEKYKDRNGNQREETEWHTIVAYGKLADIVERLVHKATKMYVEGKLKTRSWEANGRTAYKTEVIIREMQILNWVNVPAPVQEDNDDDLPDFLR